MRLLVSFTILAALARACDPTVTECSIASNGSFDILGDPAAPIGTAGSQSFPITFKPPAGYHVRILRVYGDFATVPLGSSSTGGIAGVLFGLSRSDSTGSLYADFAADGCMLYVQAFTRGEAQRAAYDNATAMDLADDNKLVLKTAVFMNTLGLTIHMEPSFVVVYRFLK